MEEWGREWKLVTDAPVLALVTLAVVAAAIWAVFKWAHKTQLDSLRAQLELKDAQLADYEDKLKGASPEQAKERVDELEAKVQQLEKKVAPRMLTPEQIREIKKAASRSVGSIIDVAHDIAAPEVKGLASLLAQCYRESGWQVRTPMSGGVGDAPSTGLAVRCKDPNARSVAEQAVLDGLYNADIPFDIQQADIGRNAPDVKIVLSVKFEAHPLAKFNL